MANGFVITKEDWEHMTPEQQSWLTFNAVQSLHGRVEAIEKKSLYNKACATIGGIVGGLAAACGLKFL